MSTESTLNAKHPSCETAAIVYMYMYYARGINVVTSLPRETSKVLTKHIVCQRDKA